MRRALALLAAAVLACGAGSAPARSAVPARALEASINGVRADHGCARLRAHPGLARVAARFSRLLLASGGLDHDSGVPFTERLWRAVPAARVVGENLAFTPGVRAQPDEVVRQWLESPPHRRVLLDCRFGQLGLGIVSGRLGDQGQGTVYTADFAG
jgi:uncharacterized protein YkwD